MLKNLNKNIKKWFTIIEMIIVLMLYSFLVVFMLYLFYYFQYERTKFNFTKYKYLTSQYIMKPGMEFICYRNEKEIRWLQWWSQKYNIESDYFVLSKKIWSKEAKFCKVLKEKVTDTANYY